MAGTFYSNSNSEITLNITYEEVRALLIEALKEVPKGRIDSSYSNVAQLAVNKGIVSNSYHQFGNPYSNQQCKLSDKDQQMIRDIFWDLVIEGVVRPDLDELNQGFPWYHITEKGKKVVGSGDTQL